MEGEIFHIYNRGNQHQPIFFTREHYRYFLKKAKLLLEPCSQVFAWTLLPTRFHFLVQSDADSCMPVKKALIPIQVLSERIRILLSSYTHAINKERNRTGNLFQQRTKAVSMTRLAYKNVKPEDCPGLYEDLPYGKYAFHYLHQLPVRMGYVEKPEDWEFSSFGSYTGRKPAGLCKTERAFQVLGLDREGFADEGQRPIPDEVIQILYHQKSWSDTL